MVQFIYKGVEDFKFRCNIFIGVRIIKEMPGSVANGTHCIMEVQYRTYIVVRVCSSLHTRTMHTQTHVHVNGHDRTILLILAKYCIRLPDDGSFVVRNMLEHI